MVNIVCLKFGTLYGPEYVNKLYNGVKRNTTIPFKFHCFTENSTDINPNIVIHDLPHNLPGHGWWQKLYMFSKDVELDGRVFFLDLDTLITGSLDDILQCKDEFVVLHDFFRILYPNKKDRFGLGKDAVGSAVMLWTAGQHTQIWDTFIENPVAAVNSLKPHGDQKWIEKQQPKRSYWQDLFPNQVVSYKVHCNKGLAKNARIVCYHGKPSIPESITKSINVQGYKLKPAPWVKDYWK
jgi:hypothetical protein